MEYILDIKLRCVLHERKISVNKLAKSSGISKSEIYHICNNEKSPTLYTMLVLAATMKVNLSDLYEFREKCPS